MPQRNEFKPGRFDPEKVVIKVDPKKVFAPSGALKQETIMGKKHVLGSIPESSEVQRERLQHLKPRKPRKQHDPVIIYVKAMNQVAGIIGEANDLGTDADNSVQKSTGLAPKVTDEINEILINR